MNAKISVIVPVYNAEKYLVECIDSILNQSFSDFELILVDDGSKDKSGDFCDKFAVDYANIKVIHQQNGGVSSARRHGLEEASGEWIAFVDADDMLFPDSLKILYSYTCDDTDFISGFANTSQNKIRKDMTVEEFRDNTTKGWLIPPTPWAKLIRKSILTDFVLDIPREIYFGEDALMLIRLSFATSKKAVIIDDIVYKYRINDDNTSSSFKRTHDYLMTLKEWRIASIPENERKKYLPNILVNSFKNFKILLDESIKSGDYAWQYSNFYKSIREDIKRCNYKLSFDEWIMSQLRPACLVHLYYKLKMLIKPM